MKSKKVLRMIGVAAVVFALSSMCVSEVYAQNLVDNGGFESGATGWTEWDSPPWPVGWTTDVFLHTYYTDCVGAIFIPGSRCVYAGSRSYRQERGTNNIHGGIYQVIDVVPGEKYEVSGYWSGGVGGDVNNNNDVAWFEVTAYQGTVGADIIDAAPRPQDIIIAKKEYTGLSGTVEFDWEPFSASPWAGGDGTFVAEGSTVTLAIKVGKVGQWNYMAGYVDNISVEAELVADFSASPTRGTPPLRVQFTDKSIGEIDSWLWDFGDGKTSSKRNPSYTYMHAGRYTVSLTVSGPAREHTEERPNYITVLPMEVPPEPAKFSASYLDVSPPQVLPNQQVEVSINIANHGGETGSHTVALCINGNFEDSRTVSVSPGSTQNVVFRVTKATPGTYEVSLEGEEGQFAVISPPTSYFPGGLSTGGIVLIAVVIIVLIVAIALVFSRTRRV